MINDLAVVKTVWCDEKNTQNVVCTAVAGIFFDLLEEVNTTTNTKHER